MSPRFIFAVFAAIAVSLSNWPLLAESPPNSAQRVSKAPRTHDVQLNGQTFTLPLGFEIELAASADLVPRPITADFDGEGRLYVGDYADTTEDVVAQLKHPPHRIVRLESTRGDGRFDKSRVFADRVPFPEGTMWLEGSLYVAAPPSIWKFTDAAGRGQADARSEWFQGKTLTHCANDLHGPYLGPDGWIYWCKGAFAQQTYERPGQPPLVTRAAHIFRCRMDGSRLEPVMIGGMDNPVAVAFLGNGERIFTTTFFQDPANGRRDGLIHDVYGAVYGKVHDVISDFPWTGPEVMPVLTHMGAAAPCGLVCYESTVFGPEYRGNLFACQFNLHKVSRHVLTASGATYASRDEDFLVSDNRDFHPTDVVEDADGSLLVIDTGGWYKICCPTSQLRKPDVLGAIYRVRRANAAPVADPRGLAIHWSQLDAAKLAALLDDARPAVRKRAMTTLGALGPAAVAAIQPLLRGEHTVEGRRNAVWTLARIDDPIARAAVRLALADPDDDVRQAALNVVSLWRDRGAVPDLLKVLETGTPLNRRVAAEALGRAGDPAAVGPLLRAAARHVDRFLDHAICYALIELSDAAAVERIGLASDDPTVLRIALVALDQMPGGKMAARQVVERLATKDADLKETLLWIAGRHPAWGDELAAYFRAELAGAATKSPAEREVLQTVLSSLTAAAAIQALIADELSAADTPPAIKELLLGVVERSRLRELPPQWTAALATLLSSPSPELIRQTVQTIRHAPPASRRDETLVQPLLAVAANGSLPDATRLAALAAAPAEVELSGRLFDYAAGFVGRDKPAIERAAAVDALARARLSNSQLLALAGVLGSTTPLDADRLLEAFKSGNDERVGQALVAALGRYDLLTSLRIDMIRPRLSKYPQSVRDAAEVLYPKINADAAQQAKRLEQILAELPAGDVRRGQAVFHSAKANCIACHALGYLGGRIGPDLTQIGRLRTERDLAESIVFPSASIVRSFEPVLVVTAAGTSYNGLIKRESTDEIELAIGADRFVRIPRTEIEEIRPSKISLMPAGFDKLLSPQELADLLAFLQGCK